jgi:hypothetical protein
MSRFILGIPLRWFLGAIVLLTGATTTGGILATLATGGAFGPIWNTEAPPPEFTIVPPLTTTAPTAGTNASPVTTVAIVPAPTLTVTAVPTNIVVPTESITLTMTVTSTVTPTTTVVASPTVTVTPTPTVTVTPTGTGMSGLAFHPAHLNAGGKSRQVYAKSGSLKNHGPGVATDVRIEPQVVVGAQWVDHVEVAPSSWAQLGTDKPARFTVYVHMKEDRAAAGKEAQIVVRLSALSSASEEYVAQATFKIKAKSPVEKPEEEKIAKADKPDKPSKSKKPKKPKKHK